MVSIVLSARPSGTPSQQHSQRMRKPLPALISILTWEVLIPSTKKVAPTTMGIMTTDTTSWKGAVWERSSALVVEAEPEIAQANTPTDRHDRGS